MSHLLAAEINKQEEIMGLMGNTSVMNQAQSNLEHPPMHLILISPHNLQQGTPGTTEETRPNLSE
jgi:hypothetical protein